MPVVRAESPVAIESLRPVSSGALVWRRSGRLSLTIVVKATLALVNEGVARLGAPIEIFHAERSRAAGSSILAESDMVPYKPRVDVTYVGFAWAPRPVQAITARLGVHGETEVLERALQVVGERHSATAQPSPFVRMPIVYERAWSGLGGENPIGVPQRSGRIANLFDPADPNRPACFGPVSRSFPARQRLLGSVDPRSLEQPTPDPQGSGVWALDVAGNLPFEYFLASPADQRLDLFTGNETIVLENLVEGQSRLHTRLPGIKALAKVFGATLPPQGQAIDLIADTVAIDGGERTVSITWRGTIPVPGTESLLRSLHVMTGVEYPGYPMQWPSPSLRSTVDLPHGAPKVPVIQEEPTPMLPLDDDTSGGSTKAISPEDAMRMLAAAKKALPFGGNPPPPPPGPPPPLEAPGQVERTLSPDEASALARKLAEHQPLPSGQQMPQEPALRRPKMTGRTSRAAVAEAAAAATPPPPPAPAPPEPVRPPPTGPLPVSPAPAFPAHGSPSPPAVVKGSPPRGTPDIVVRPHGYQPSAGSMDDEDSSIGSTVAFSPEAAAELLARRTGKQPGAQSPTSPHLPPPQAQGLQPPPLAPPLQSPPDLGDDPIDSSAGSTMAFSPEAAAQLIAKRMAELGAAAPPRLPGAPLGPPPAPPPPAPPPPAPPPPAPPPPAGAPALTRSNTLVMEAPSEANAPQGARKSR